MQDLTLVDLTDLLPTATVMVVSVTGSSTSGKPLSDDDLRETLLGCAEVMQLFEDRSKVRLINEGGSVGLSQWRDLLSDLITLPCLQRPRPPSPPLTPVHSLVSVLCLPQILTFVQSRMNVIAPNTCALVGSGIASQLLGLAGGLTALSRIPGCNIAVRAAWPIESCVGM